MEPLLPGDPIDVVAPSSAFDRERFDSGILALREIGLVPRFAKDIFTRTAHLAGDDARRKAELERALQGDAKAVILARGGYGLLRFASELRSVPQKMVVGYSDATILHELWRRAGVPSIHGPMCTQLGEDDVALQRLEALLFGHPTKAISWAPRSAVGGTAQAPLAGGNLATLASMCGTLLQPRLDGCIVLLEDLNEPPYRLDRLLTQLLLSGAFDAVKGFVVGDLTAPGEDPQGREEVFAERLSRLEVPVAFGAPFGHAGRNLPVAFGCAHALDADKGTLTPLEAPVVRAQS
ncbi:MAG TPA: LD-carboxypeptidase [Myxococcales bacterium]|nr:LD-carboxypeptidase [Myxococcales bacterium]